MTNGDKIRNMTDDELVKCIMMLTAGDPWCPPWNEFRCCHECDECWVKWLDSEVDT